MTQPQTAPDSRRQNPRDDIGRPNARSHVTFGRGPHACPGAPLARAEGRIILERLFDRTTEIRID